MNRALLSVFFCSVLAAIPIAPNAFGKAGYLCQYEQTWVPCFRLSHPVTVWAYRFDYRPTKWIPLWPNNSIFGGKLYTRGDVNPEDVVAQRFDPSIPNIETIPFAPPIFDRSYVDADVAGMSVYMEEGIKEHVGLINVRKAYRGLEVFSAWQSAPAAGIQCAESPPDPYTERPERTCVFARRSSKLRTKHIEYCTYQEDSESHIRSNVTCTIVTAEENEKWSILAIRYTTQAFQGGDYAGEFRCTVPGRTIDEVLRAVEQFATSSLGQSSKFTRISPPDGALGYKAEGINIEDKTERMFLRAFLSGYFNQTERKQKRPSSVNVSMNYYYTV